MYEIHIKLRNVVTGEEENYRTTYKSKGKAARDAIRYTEEIAPKYKLPEEELTASVVKVKK
ncbi:hypothetical protein PJ747_003775 [Escherichia coli]|uniref:hypothetical protein n=1 Tax=Escherichia coli TaxID=562 RepID=UPI000C1C17D7|nr:hypothetical protein [Escherichia coli]EET2950097.1 hypothetical protein [Escherichia coli]EET6372546.1 hypothetical protein [Escherichia coli]EEV0258668.1 hypothetical protein [Escherichia coli]EEX9743225.1 hypothetical protein [Escherichia coli]EEY1411267.1 hypothetical protein [Escherichia coli]